MEKSEQLKMLVLRELPVEPQGWMLASLDEVCETVVRDNPALSLEELTLPTCLAYAAALTAFQSTIKAGLAAANGGLLTINYRGQTFEFRDPPHR